MDRRSMTVDGGMFYPFRNGSPTFTTHLNTLIVTEGNVVEMRINSGVNYDIGVMVSDWRLNTADGGNGTGNVANAQKIFKMHAGDVLSWEIEPIDVTYANANAGTTQMWLIIRNQAGAFQSLMNNIVLNTMMQHGTYSGSVTLDNDMDYYGVSGGIHKYYSYAVSVKFRVKLYLNGVRFV